MSEEQLKNMITTLDEALKELLPHDVEHGEHLVEAMNYSLLAGGKRLRPCLLLASCEAVGGTINRKAVIQTACALECIHTYSLIHDDLPGMDDDALRRGKPTNHIVYGEGTAILAGDALLTEAFAILSREWRKEDEAKLGLDLIDMLAEASGGRGMVLGQSVDLSCEGKPIDKGTMQFIHSHKTGALIQAACKMGARIGEASPAEMDAIEKYADYIGIAYQIIDDILDVSGQEDILGKPVGSDEKNHKATYPSLYGLETSRKMAEDLIEKAKEELEKLSGDIENLNYLTTRIITRNK